jgi:membrane protease subunit HflC
VRKLVLLLVCAALVVLGLSCVVIVDETEHVVVTQFGRPVAVHSEAGLYAKLPAPIQRVTRVDKRTLFTESGETELLTADKKNVVVATYLAWRVTDPVRFLRAVRDREFAEARLGALVQSELGGALGDVPFTDLVPAKDDGTGLAQIERKVHLATNEVARADFGVEVTSLGVSRLSFPPQNLQSVFARMRSERERIARGLRSEGAAEGQKIKAEADRERAETIANAEAEAARLRGEGEAESARVYADAYRGHEDFYGFLRTLQSYEKVLGEKTTLVLPADSPFLELLLSRKAPGAKKDGDAAEAR